MITANRRIQREKPTGEPNGVTWKPNWRTKCENQTGEQTCWFIRPGLCSSGKCRRSSSWLNCFLGSRILAWENSNSLPKPTTQIALNDSCRPLATAYQRSPTASRRVDLLVPVNWRATNLNHNWIRLDAERGETIKRASGLFMIWISYVSIIWRIREDSRRFEKMSVAM